MAVAPLLLLPFTAGCRKRESTMERRERDSARDDDEDGSQPSPSSSLPSALHHLLVQDPSDMAAPGGNIGGPSESISRREGERGRERPVAGASATYSLPPPPAGRPQQGYPLRPVPASGMAYGEGSSRAASARHPRHSQSPERFDGRTSTAVLSVPHTHASHTHPAQPQPVARRPSPLRYSPYQHQQPYPERPRSSASDVGPSRRPARQIQPADTYLQHSFDEQGVGSAYSYPPQGAPFPNSNQYYNPQHQLHHRYSEPAYRRESHSLPRLSPSRHPMTDAEHQQQLQQQHQAVFPTAPTGAPPGAYVLPVSAPPPAPKSEEFDEPVEEKPRGRGGKKRRASDEDGDYRDAGPRKAATKRTGKVPQKVLVACNFCRGRKLRCDGGKPACWNCTSRQLQCDYVDVLRRRGPGKAPKGTRTKQKRQGSKDSSEPPQHEQQQQQQPQPPQQQQPPQGPPGAQYSAPSFNPEMEHPDNRGQNVRVNQIPAPSYAPPQHGHQYIVDNSNMQGAPPPHGHPHPGQPPFHFAPWPGPPPIAGPPMPGPPPPMDPHGHPHPAYAHHPMAQPYPGPPPPQHPQEQREFTATPTGRATRPPTTKTRGGGSATESEISHSDSEEDAQ